MLDGSLSGDTEGVAIAVSAEAGSKATEEPQLEQNRLLSGSSREQDGHVRMPEMITHGPVS